MKKHIEDLEIVENAIIHIYDNQEVKIELNRDLILRFAFKIDEVDNKTSVKQKLNSDADLTIECYNFNSPKGEGIIKPFRVGTFDGKNLYISFFVWTVNANSGMHILTYNILTQK